MRIAVIGSGGVGGYFGGLLAQAGKDVTFIARGVHLEAPRKSGITVRSRVTGDFSIPVKVTDDPREVGVTDLVLFCVKTYDLETAAATLPPMIGPDTVVLPLQNGIDSADRLGKILGPEHIIGGVTYIISTCIAPGEIVHLSNNKIIFGEIKSGISERVELLYDLFSDTPILGELHSNIRVPIWEKFILLAASGGVMALTRLTIGPIRDYKETKDFFCGVMEEAAAVARALGIQISENIIERHWNLALGLAPSASSSMYAGYDGRSPIRTRSVKWCCCPAW
jgi:2-dehydropantoate 2-reductase